MYSISSGTSEYKIFLRYIYYVIVRGLCKGDTAIECAPELMTLPTSLG